MESAEKRVAEQESGVRGGARRFDKVKKERSSRPVKHVGKSDDNIDREDGNDGNAHRGVLSVNDENGELQETQTGEQHVIVKKIHVQGFDGNEHEQRLLVENAQLNVAQHCRRQQ